MNKLKRQIRRIMFLIALPQLRAYEAYRLLCEWTEYRERMRRMGSMAIDDSRFIEQAKKVIDGRLNERTGQFE